MANGILQVTFFMMIGWLIYTWGHEAKDNAQAICELSHSHDTCFAALNR